MIRSKGRVNISYTQDMQEICIHNELIRVSAQSDDHAPCSGYGLNTTIVINYVY